jgi:hypothetical protein
MPGAPVRPDSQKEIRAMARRPDILNDAHVEEALRNVIRSRNQNLKLDQSVSATISCMRLIIPLLIRDAKSEGLQRVFSDAASELGQKDVARWDQMAKDIVTWAEKEIEQFKAS